MRKILMPKPVELTEQENTLAEEVRDAARLLRNNHDYERTINAGYASRQLMESLLKREAIPEQRLRYFTDAAYNSGHTKGSRYELFRRNTASNSEMYEHPHFWKYLLYFLDGPELPSEVAERFASLCADQVRDHGSVEKLARATARTIPGDPAEKAEELFKLVMECGGTLSEATNVRRTVRTIKA